MLIAFLFRRIRQIVITMAFALIFIFLLVQLTPGDPVLVILQDHFQQSTYDAVAARLGLDQPLWTQFTTYLSDVVRGDWGSSFRTGRDVLTTILEQLPYTLQLAVASIIVALLIGVPLGVISALKRNTWADYAAMIIALLAVCMPSFWLGILLLLLFSVSLGWLPLLGAGNPSDPSSVLIYLVLPSLALGSRMAALIARMTRASILDTMSQDYVRTARAKGLPERLVLWRHVARNSVIPVLTVVGLDLGNALGGSAVIEIVFSRPGIGRLLVDSLIARDYPLIQGTLLLITLMVLLVNLLVDILYSVVDPRIRLT